MDRETNHRIRKRFNDGIYNIARYTEIMLSIVILVVIALAGLRLIMSISEVSIWDMDISFFTKFLANALSLVVCGVCKDALPPFCPDSGRSPDVCNSQTDGC